MMRDPADMPSPFELIPKTDTPLEEDDDIPSFCKTVFTCGLVGGFLRIPVVFLFLLALSTCLQAGVTFHNSGPVLPVLLVATLATAAMTCLGIGGNVALLNERPNALSWGCVALGLAVLLHLFWIYALGAFALFSIGEAPAFAASLVAFLLVRSAFLIAYGVALHRYREWLRWGWY